MRNVIGIACSFCEAKVNADITAAQVVHDSEGYPEYRVALAKCPGCQNALLAHEICTRASWQLEECEFSPPVRVWPRPERTAQSSIPEIVQVSLDEADKCQRSGAYTAGAVMCGRALEGVCIHFGIKSMLAKGLAELRDRKLIDERLFDWGEQLRKHRNLAAHASKERITREDANDLFEFVTAICEYIFVLSSRFQEFMARKEKTSTVLESEPGTDEVIDG